MRLFLNMRLILRRLKNPRLRYSTVEKELLAIKLPTNAFGYLVGHFTSLLTTVLSRIAGTKNTMGLMRWSLALQLNNITVQHRPRKDNGNAA